MSRLQGQHARQAPLGASAQAQKKCEYFYHNKDLDKWVSSFVSFEIAFIRKYRYLVMLLIQSNIIEDR